MRFFLNMMTLLFWLVLLAGGYIAYDAYTFLHSPASETPQELTLEIAPGATFDRVAWDLKKAGAITDVTRFRWLAQIKGTLAKVRAGEYAINTGWTPEQVLFQITQGRSILYRLSVREGLTWWETARAVEAQGFATYDDFMAVVHDPEFLREHAIPLANAESFLYPETYMMKKPRSPLDREQARIVASTMVAMFWKQTRPVWAQLPLKPEAVQKRLPQTVDGDGDRAGAGSPPSASETALQAAPTVNPTDVDPNALRRLLILASLVEKETGVPEERPRVAGVYANRLRLNMLLQCDPTIIYGVGPSFSGAIRRSQLDDPKNLYNTYQHPGLPPGPICSPGLESLKAALQPEVHEYLYFVATGIDAGHTFSKTLVEHNKAVQIYRARMRAQQQ